MPLMLTLLVIDAQKDRFDALHHSKRSRALQNILDEISIATINGDGIIFTMLGEGRPHPSIVKLAKGYRRVSYINRDGDDGGSRVAEVIRSRRFALSYIRTFGLYTLSSVRETITSLSQELEEESMIEIAAGSCADPKPKADYDFDWSWFLENVVISDSGRRAHPRRRMYL